MTTPRTEAVAIVHAGLPDVLDWLGETPVTAHEPRHAALPFTFTIRRACDAREHVIEVAP